MGVSKNQGTLCGGPYNKDPTIQGTILGSPIFGNSHIVKLSSSDSNDYSSCTSHSNNRSTNIISNINNHNNHNNNKPRPQNVGYMLFAFRPTQSVLSTCIGLGLWGWLRVWGIHTQTTMYFLPYKPCFLPYGSFRKFGVPYLGVLIIRLLLFRVTILGSPIVGIS